MNSHIWEHYSNQYFESHKIMKPTRKFYCIFIIDISFLKISNILLINY